MITEIAITEAWPMGHRLMNHDGACRFLHGHTYRVQATFDGVVQSTGSQDGMVADFTALKGLIRAVVAELDHSLVLQTTDPAIAAVEDFARLVCVPFPPTAERLAEWFYDRLQPICNTVTLWESETTWARVIR